MRACSVIVYYRLVTTVLGQTTENARILLCPLPRIGVSPGVIVVGQKIRRSVRILEKHFCLLDLC